MWAGHGGVEDAVGLDEPLLLVQLVHDHAALGNLAAVPSHVVHG